MQTISATSHALYMRARYARELSDQALKPIVRKRLLAIAAKLDALARGQEPQSSMIENASAISKARTTG